MVCPAQQNLARKKNSGQTCLRSRKKPITTIFAQALCSLLAGYQNHVSGQTGKQYLCTNSYCQTKILSASSFFHLNRAMFCWGETGQRHLVSGNWQHGGSDVAIVQVGGCDPPAPKVPWPQNCHHDYFPHPLVLILNLLVLLDIWPGQFGLSILPKRCLKSKTIGKDIGKDSTCAKIQQCTIIGKFAQMGEIHYTDGQKCTTCITLHCRQCGAD